MQRPGLHSERSAATPCRELRGWVVLASLVCGLKPAAAAPAPTEAVSPVMVRRGDRLFVPAGSPLRDRLAVAPVLSAVTSRPIDLPAVVEADPAATINVVAPATGRLVTLPVRLGDTVRRGQLLATIDAPDAAQAWADSVKARDALALARMALERAIAVNAIGSNAVKDVEAAQSNVAQDGAELQRADARLQVFGVAPDRADSDARRGMLHLKAPTGGAVTALNSAPGAYLNDATAVLLTVVNLDHVWVTANVPENLIGLAVVGAPASVTLPAYPGLRLQGKVVSVSAVLDADTRRNKVRIAFANPGGRLKPNMYASAALTAPATAQLQVPPSALLMNNDSVTVFVETEPWTFVRRAVELGTEDADHVEVRRGLQSGDRVVVRGGVLLND